jgi:hypothetical protein
MTWLEPFSFLRAMRKPRETGGLPSGKHTKKHGKIINPPCFMGKIAISCYFYGDFPSYVKLPEVTYRDS